MQTAIIIRHGDIEILVRIHGVHVDDDDVQVDTRPTYEYNATWYPYNMRLVDVRRERT